MYIILLGEGCHISQTVRPLNLESLKECSIFEWFLSAYFSDVNKILQKVADGQDLKVTHNNEFPRDLFMDDTRIRTTHYPEEILEAKLKRRVDRFLQQVKSNDFVLFIRQEHSAALTTPQEIEEFKSIIAKINPECNYKLLILMPLNDGSVPYLPDIERVYHRKNYAHENKTLEYIKEAQL